MTVLEKKLNEDTNYTNFVEKSMTNPEFDFENDSDFQALESNKNYEKLVLLQEECQGIIESTEYQSWTNKFDEYTKYGQLC